MAGREKGYQKGSWEDSVVQATEKQSSLFMFNIAAQNC